MSLAKYKKVKYLGKGSYGAALLVCLKANPDRKFVIKEIVVGHLKQAEKDAAEQEAKVLSQMTHSNITMYIESFIEGSKLYIVMEHADGGDLTAAVKRRASSGMKWPENEVMRIFVQICLALKHVHDHNILHRDLKSQNIFLTQKGIVKLGDFGIAKVLDATEGQAQTQIGTPYYLSPEICESKPYGRKSDVWSLGIVLFELLALELPFQAQSLPALVIRICSADPDYGKIDKSYSSQMVHWVQALLHKNPDTRPEVPEMINSQYFKMHISRLLSHTIRLGCGGAEGAVGADGPPGGDMEGDIDTDEVDRNIERERQRQRQQAEQEERNSKEAMERAERDARRKEEIDKLKKMKYDMAKRKDEMSEDVVYVPSNQSAVRAPPVVHPPSGREGGHPHHHEEHQDPSHVHARDRDYRDYGREDKRDADPRRRGHIPPSASHYSEEEEELYRRALVREQYEREKAERVREERHAHEQADRRRNSDPHEEEYTRAMHRGMDGYRRPDGHPRGGEVVVRERSLADIRDDRMRQRLEAERQYVANEGGTHRDRDGGGYVSHEEQLRRHKDEIRRQYQENQSRANEYRRKAAGAGQLFSAPAEDRALLRQPSQEQKFESAARREFFANRAAAQQIKARVEAYERGGAAGPSIPSVPVSQHAKAPERPERVSPRLEVQGGDRVAMIKAQKQYEREMEVREHERRIQLAVQEQVEERRRYEERMTQQGVLRRPSDVSEHSREVVPPSDHRDQSEYEDAEAQRRKRDQEKAAQREREEREHIEELERARLQQKEQRRLIRENSESPAAVAFEVNFDDDNAKKKPISPAIAALRAGKKSPASGSAPRQRRGWGAPSVPAVLSGEAKPALHRINDSPTELVSDEAKEYVDIDHDAQDSKDGAANLSRQMETEEIPEETMLLNVQASQADIKPHYTGINPGGAKAVGSYDLSSLMYDTRDIDEDEEAVLRVIDARKEREEQARDQAREVFRKLREQRRKEAASRGQSSALSRGPRGASTRESGAGGPIKRRSPPKRPKQSPKISPTKSPSKRSEEEAKSVAMMKTADGLYELSSSSGDSDVAGEVDDDLESTLDRYLLRKKSLAKKNESKTEEVDHVEDEVEEEPGLRQQDDSPGVVDDDGAMADLQCMLANALMESGPFTPLTVEEDDDEAEEGKA